MSKIGNFFKKHFLLCYSNAEKEGVIDKAQDLTIEAINKVMDTLVITGVLNRNLNEVIKQGVTTSVQSAFAALDNHLDMEIEAMGITETNS